MWDVIGAVIMGLILGSVGKLLMPGRDGGGFLATAALGLAGSVLGYLVFSKLLKIGDNHEFLSAGGIVSGLIGVVILLAIWRAIAPKA